MATLYVMQAGRTEWSRQNRIDSIAGASLTEDGAAAAREIAAELRDRGIAAVYSSPNESDCQTAQIAAEVLGVRPRLDVDLRELDYGLWQGLLVEDVKQRHARAYRQWMEAPTSVCPPEGETLEEAAGRLDGALQRILKRQRGRNVLLVVHPVAAGLLRCRLAGSDLSNIWDCVNWPGAWEQYDAAPPARPREAKT